jgi:hypothetical protein
VRCILDQEPRSLTMTIVLAAAATWHARGMRFITAAILG